MQCTVKPFLRWAGSKSKLVPKLSEYYFRCDAERYVEPFVGCGALFFSINPESALVSDKNTELVSAYQAVKLHPRAVFNRYNKFTVGADEYYKLRSKYSSIKNPIDRAATFIYLNRFCFNGIYRTNKNGEFNVPFAKTKTGKLPSLHALKAVSKRLENVDIRSGDFGSILGNRIRKNDFIYMDPPYAVKNRRIFKQYGSDEFGSDDLQRLSELLQRIDNRGAHFLVSYALCSEAIEVFDGWNIKRVATDRNVAGFAKHRKRAIEILATNIEL